MINFIINKAKPYTLSNLYDNLFKEDLNVGGLLGAMFFGR